MADAEDKTDAPAPLNARDDPAWWKERNKRRRDRYERDPDYRDQQRESSRKSYRDRSAGGKNVPVFDPRQNLEHFDQFGKVRRVTLPNGFEVERWCLTKAEVAAVFGRTVKLFYHWLKDGRFPPPILTALDYPITRDYANKKGVKVPQRVTVYTAEEVRASVEALGPHLADVAYYRADHGKQKALVIAAIAKVREDILPKGSAK